MLFDYNDIETVSRDGKRFYDCNGKHYPSITTILGHTMPDEKKQILDKWKARIGDKEADKILKQSGKRGSAVHDMIEKYLLKDPIVFNKYTKEEIEMFSSIKLHLRDITKVYGLEVALFSDNLEVAGRTDCIGHYASKDSIIDFKTSRRIKTEHDIEDYWLQCTFYAIAHNEQYKTNIHTGVIIMATEAGVPLVFKQDLAQYVKPLVERIEKYNEVYK